MCGIFTLISQNAFMSHELSQTNADSDDFTQNETKQRTFATSDFSDMLSRRGPDSIQQINIQLDNEVSIFMMGSLLQLQGYEKVSLPFVDVDGNVLIYNGEIYDGLNISAKENDGKTLINTFSHIETDNGLVNVLNCLMGPWSLVYWNQEKQELWFGRDHVGRRSLLMTHYEDQLFLSSTSSGCMPCLKWEELRPAIYKLCLNERTSPLIPQVVHEWNALHSPGRTLMFDNLEQASAALITRLRTAVEKRSPLPITKMNCVDEGYSPVLVLFSGGVDSTLVAGLLHNILPAHLPIDLCNVSFDGDLAPDRISALEALTVLRDWAPKREWKLIAVDSSLEAIDELKPHILSLLHPCDTIMDFNIGAPLWLAAQAHGMLQATPTVPYKSQAKIVLLGHGADEQCAGYSRHRTKFREGGLENVEKELHLEMNRLWKRNLGRDDRLISDHGREARFPFLDETIIDFISQLPMSYLFDPSKARGIGEKIVLRECLRQLGLGALSTQPKRAIQFGSRIGKLSNKQRFGSNRAANKSHAGSLILDDCQSNCNLNMQL